MTMKRSRHDTRAVLGALLAAWILAGTGCAASDGGDVPADAVEAAGDTPPGIDVAILPSAQLKVSPSTQTVAVDLGTLASGETKTVATFTLTNAGSGRKLCIGDITLAYTPATEQENASPDGPAFKLDRPAVPACIAPKGEGAIDGTPESLVFSVRFTNYDDNRMRVADVTILSDDTEDPGRRTYGIHFAVNPCNPTLDVPAVLDFGTVTKTNPIVEKTLDLTNTGSCKLLFDAFRIEGDPNFKVTLGNAEYDSSNSMAMTSIDPPLVIDPLTSAQWKVTFTAQTGDPASATLTVHSNDAQATQGTAVTLIANASGPRLHVIPSPIEFGGKLIGKVAAIEVQIHSVGTGPVTLTGIHLKDPAETHFDLDYSKLTATAGQAPTVASPLVIPANQSEVVQVRYLPTVMNPIDPVTGQVIPDVNQIVFDNDSFDSPLEIAVSGFGVAVECPIPVILAEEGEEVPPQTVVHLHGDQSQPSSGSIQSYQWTVTQPPENKFNLAPSASYPNPTHEVNIAGDYTYCLDVCDAQYCSNDPQCHTTACKKVAVIPNQAIHVELTWDTPGDLNPFDEGADAGADLDLHFAHPFATGPDIDGDGKPDPWFDAIYDTFWFNPHPNWESASPNVGDDPRLDRDDTDGAGPENVDLDVPASGRLYHVGVHYWDDHGYGFSYPRIKIYIWGQLVYDEDLKNVGAKLFKCDLWDVATIQWPQGAITSGKNPDGSQRITHGYQHPAYAKVGGGGCNP